MGYGPNVNRRFTIALLGCQSLALAITPPGLPRQLRRGQGITGAQRQQNGASATGIAVPIEQRLAVMAADIRRLIPAAEVRLFGSRARGGARPDSDVDLLITAPDAWLCGARGLQSRGSARWPALSPPAAQQCLEKTAQGLAAHPGDSAAIHP
jgi:hypothetical protein